ncbi:MAG TPA: NlpC/P60 family protein [Candidatus Ozemobacteraceae bacterium]|nr:NlpC/P60 family protein [Candidatus Ozemobacteraceae bacterium]
MRTFIIFLVIFWCSPIPAFCQTNPYADQPVTMPTAVPIGVSDAAVMPELPVTPANPLASATPDAMTAHDKLQDNLALFKNLLKAGKYREASIVLGRIQDDAKDVTDKKTKRVFPGTWRKMKEGFIDQSRIDELKGTLASLKNQMYAECVAKMLKEARNHEGVSSKEGPGGGTVACAWMVSKVLRAAGMVPAGWEELGALALTQRMVKEQNWKKVTPGKGKPMTKALMKPGDIVFWDPSDHVGVYLGDGMAFSNSSSDREGKIHPVSGYYDGWVPRFTVRPPGA